jgi:hypothetical protein
MKAVELKRNNKNLSFSPPGGTADKFKIIELKKEMQNLSNKLIPSSISGSIKITKF